MTAVSKKTKFVIFALALALVANIQVVVAQNGSSEGSQSGGSASSGKNDSSNNKQENTSSKGSSSNQSNKDSQGTNDSQDTTSDGGDTKDSSGGDSSDSSSFDTMGQPGRITMITPPRSMQSPLFELDSLVYLSWNYDDYMTNPPKNLMIVGEMPAGNTQPGSNTPIRWDIAQNISTKNYTWDTQTQTPPGIALPVSSGYKMYFYDGDLGWSESDKVHEGQLIKFALPFSMFRSQYNNTNDGVPKDYNPNSAPGISRPSLNVLFSVVGLVAFAATML